MNPNLSSAKVLVVGAGIMGAGIAQVAAQAGHSVYLMDAREGAAQQACAKLRESLDALLAKGKFTQVQVDGILARIQPVDSFAQALDAGLVGRPDASDVGMLAFGLVALALLTSRTVFFALAMKRDPQ